jgi:hypothetical protein
MKLTSIFSAMIVLTGTATAQNVGIGTATPLNRLHVSSSSTLALRIENPIGLSSEINFANSTGTAAYIGLFNDDLELITLGSRYTYFGNINAHQMALSPTGFLGIGTLTPASRLHVNGQVSITGGNVLEFGQGIVAKEPSAGKIGYATFTANTLDVVGAGNSIGARRIRFWNEGGASFEGTISLAAGELNHAQTGTANLIPAAYGTIEGTTGSILSGSGNFTVSRGSTGSYSITLNGKSLTAANSACLLTIVSDGTSAYIAMAYSSGNMIVRIVNNDATNRVDRNYSFLVYQP